MKYYSKKNVRYIFKTLKNKHLRCTQAFIIFENKYPKWLAAFRQDSFEITISCGHNEDFLGVQKPESEAVLRSATPSLD